MMMMIDEWFHIALTTLEINTRIHSLEMSFFGFVDVG